MKVWNLPDKFFPILGLNLAHDQFSTKPNNLPCVEYEWVCNIPLIEYSKVNHLFLWKISMWCATCWPLAQCASSDDKLQPWFNNNWFKKLFTTFRWFFMAIFFLQEIWLWLLSCYKIIWLLLVIINGFPV